MSDTLPNSPSPEVYTRYPSNDPIYSVYNNDYGMDLAWSYLPADLDKEIDFDKDFFLDTGLRCNTLVALGPVLRSIFRDLASIHIVDERNMSVLNAAEVIYPSLSMNLVHSLAIGSQDIYKNCWSGTDSNDIFGLANYASSVPTVGVKALKPWLFSYFVNYTEVLQDNALISFEGFIEKKMNDIYSVSCDKRIIDSIFTTPREDHVDFSSLRQVRNNTGNIKTFCSCPLDYDLISSLITVSLAPQYMMRASFIMHPDRYQALRSCPGNWGSPRRDDGQILLCGVPVTLSDFMPPDAIIFGDFNQAFTIADYGAPVVRDVMDSERYQLTGQYPSMTYHDAKLKAKMFRHKMAFVVSDENALVIASGGALPSVPSSEGSSPLSSTFYEQPYDSRSRRRSRN